MPYISSLPITTISTRQRGPCTAKLFITLRGGQKHAWLLHSMPLPLFLSVSNIKEQPGGENDIQAISPSLCGHRMRCASTSPNYHSGVELGFGLRTMADQRLAGSPTVHMGEKGGWHPGAPCITWDVFVYTFIYISGQQGNVSQR